MFPEWVSFSSNTVYKQKHTSVLNKHLSVDIQMYIHSFIKSSHIKYGVCSHENTLKCLLTACFNNYLQTMVHHVYHFSTSDNQ